VAVAVGVAAAVAVVVDVGVETMAALGEDKTPGARCGAGVAGIAGVGVGAASAAVGAAMLSTSNPTAGMSDRRMRPA
jgi:hypothetical protein